jgi:hypothetical protein
MDESTGCALTMNISVTFKMLVNKAKNKTMAVVC